MERALHNVLVFSLGGQGYALELRWVREVVTLGHVTPVPLAPPAVLGLVNLQGAIAPVLDAGPLADAARSGAAQGDSAVVVDVEGVRAALRVDSVDEVSSLPPGDDEGTLVAAGGREVRLLRPPALLRRVRTATEAAARGPDAA